MNEQMITKEQVSYDFGLCQPCQLNSLHFSKDLEENTFRKKPSHVWKNACGWQSESHFAE